MESLDLEGQPVKKGRTHKREESPSQSKQSYIAAVTGGHAAGGETPSQGWPEEDPITVEDGDITPVISEQGGSLLLSQTLKAKLDKQWERAVVLKVLGRRVGFAILHDRLQAQWRFRGRMKMIDLDNGFFLVKFQEEGDYFRVLTEGPWVVFAQAVAVQRWSPSFRPSQAVVSHAVVWIRIPNLPLSRYHPRILTALGDLVGASVRLDEETMLANRGKFARIAVEIDLHRPLTPSIELDGLPQVCVRCGVLGHSPTACASGAPTAPPDTLPAQSVGVPVPEQGGSAPAAGGQMDPASSNGYGPWTHVQRRRPPTVRGQGQQRASSARTKQAQGGSRFVVLLNADTVVEKTNHQAPNETAGLPIGMGQRLSLFSFNLTEKPTQQSRPPKAADRSRVPARGAKGKGLIKIAQPRVDQGQTSADPAPSSVLDLPIRLKPTTSDPDLVVTIPTHSEMICDNTIIVGPTPAVADDPLGMDEMADPRAPRGIPAISIEEPPDIAMALVGQEDCSGSGLPSLETPVSVPVEPEDIQVEPSVAELR
ncbi:hypothetical protein K2173_022277 [Erythroxylum novogranatense]|uniref:DUF4283 domain-containing protein n=1 Tax=Erythroxylum novogranatense TaxID=1862640 RepID=A0AAV8TJU5_9ROSI|nr:hypothetical protein K2173_022277 [Erythroxylum novogranatense]